MSDGKSMDIWTATRTFLEKNPGVKRKELLPYVMKKTGKGRSVICDAFATFDNQGKVHREKGRYWLKTPLKKIDRKDFEQVLRDLALEYGALSPEELKENKLAILEIPKMFEEIKDWRRTIVPLTVKTDNLNIRQWLVLWFHEDVFLFMHAARKIMGIKNAKLPSEKAFKYIEEWIAHTKQDIAEGWEQTLRWIAKEGKKSWENALGSYEDDPLPFFKGLWKFEQTLKEARERAEQELEQHLKIGESKEYL